MHLFGKKPEQHHHSLQTYPDVRFCATCAGAFKPGLMQEVTRKRMPVSQGSELIDTLYYCSAHKKAYDLVELHLGFGEDSAAYYVRQSPLRRITEIGQDWEWWYKQVLEKRRTEAFRQAEDPWETSA